MTPATAFAGCKVALFGLGGSGLATLEALVAGGADVLAWDDSEESRAKVRQKGFTVADLRTADWSDFAALVLSPGVPLTHPEPHWTVALAKGAGLEIIGDVEVFCRERAKIAPHAPFVAITGTNGKSTTTALVAHILRQGGKDVQMGGNIGTPILSLEPPADDRVHVVEMSSFQIDLTPSLNPTVGVLLNISPDHLDRHGTMENYAAIKERLVAGASTPVVGIDDTYSRDIAERLRARTSHEYRISELGELSQIDQGFAVRGGRVLRIFSRRDGVIWLAGLDGIGSLRGRHNAQNAAAALAATNLLHLALGREVENAALEQVAAREEGRRLIEVSSHDDRLGEVTRAALKEINPDQWLLRADLFQKALESFPGLHHRMEEVARRGSVLFVNDSKATNADSAEKALMSFERPIFWILGGKPKEGGIESLKPYFTKIERAYLIGEATEAFAATLEGQVPYLRCGTLDRAVPAAAEDAAAGAECVVLLSPACASYDQYRNFEIRGDHFRDLVLALPGLEPIGRIIGSR